MPDNYLALVASYQLFCHDEDHPSIMCVDVLFITEFNFDREKHANLGISVLLDLPI